MVQRRAKTQTYSFGAGRRESHDSTPFYSRKIYKDLTLPKPRSEDLIENDLPEEFLDKLIVGDAREVLRRMPKNSVHLMVTSPPYNVGKEYDEDLTIGEYLEFLEQVLREVYRVLVWGGRICFNVADLGRKPYLPMHVYVTNLLEEIGFLLRGIIIWYKGDAPGASSTAWGTFASPVNPVLRDVHEYIIVASKGDFSRKPKPGSKITITKEEFIEFTRSVWKFPPESARKIGHPAPFPVELPYRCIQLYTFKGDVVLDPFVGSGTTAVAAVMTGRHYVGIDINEEYIKLAEKRVGEARKQRRMTEYLF